MKTTTVAVDPYVIKMADLQDGPQIRAFIDRYWKSGHALAVSQELFDWQHLNPLHQRIHFVLAQARQTGEILALCTWIRKHAKTVWQTTSWQWPAMK